MRAGWVIVFHSSCSCSIIDRTSRPKELTMTATLTADRVELTSAGHADSQLNATYRCDRCSAQAYIRTTFRKTNDEGENLQMFFCGHHANEYENKLMPLLIEWHDERERLNEDRKKGSEN